MGKKKKGTLLHYWWECKLMQPLGRTIWRFLKKLGINLPYDPTIPLLCIYPEKATFQKDTFTPVFTAALFTTARTWKQQMSIDRWMDKEDVVRICNGIFLSHKKEQTWVICSEVDEPTACYTEQSKSGREKQIIYQYTYEESRKMILMNLFSGKEWRHRHREQTCGHSRGRRGWDKLRK